MRECIISHKNCPDGCACIVLAKKVYPEIQYTIATHSLIDDIVLKKALEIEEAGIMYITDISPTREGLDKLIEILIPKGVQLYIYEHHETQKWLETYVLPEKLSGKIVFTNAYCATMIFYKEKIENHPVLNEYKEFVEVINDRDMWINKRPEGADFSILNNILGDASFINRFVKIPLVKLKDKEEILLSYKKKKDAEYATKMLSKIELLEDKEGYKYGVMYGEGGASDVLNKAIEDFDLEYAIMVNLHNKTGSIRGRGKFDCSVFAARYGGGGHKKASGFRINFEYKFPEDRDVHK